MTTDRRMDGQAEYNRALPTFVCGAQMKELEWSQDFPHFNLMEDICCHGNQSSDQLLPKTLRSQSPTPMMLLMKFDYDWPAGFRDFHV